MKNIKRNVEDMALPSLDGVAPFLAPKQDKVHRWFKVNDRDELEAVCNYYAHGHAGRQPADYPAVVCVEHPDYPINRDKGEKYLSVDFITAEECYHNWSAFWNKIKDATLAAAD